MCWIVEYTSSISSETAEIAGYQAVDRINLEIRLPFSHTPVPRPDSVDVTVYLFWLLLSTKGVHARAIGAQNILICAPTIGDFAVNEVIGRFPLSFSNRVTAFRTDAKKLVLTCIRKIRVFLLTFEAHK